MKLSNNIQVLLLIVLGCVGLFFIGFGFKIPSWTEMVLGIYFFFFIFFIIAGVALVDKLIGKEKDIVRMKNNIVGRIFYLICIAIIVLLLLVQFFAPRLGG